MTTRKIEWTAREVMACAYCWAEFSKPEAMSGTPEEYWLSITERARNECREIAKRRLLLAVARGEAAAVLPVASLRPSEFDALKAELGMKADHRVRSILEAVRRVFTKSAAMPLHPGDTP